MFGVLSRGERSAFALADVCSRLWIDSLRGTMFFVKNSGRSQSDSRHVGVEFLTHGAQQRACIGPLSVGISGHTHWSRRPVHSAR